MIRLTGKEVAEAIKGIVAEGLEKLGGYIPTLCIVRVGERPDDLSYERGSVKRMSALGLNVRTEAFPADISEEAFEEGFLRLNRDPSVDGILLLRPLPKTLDEKRITRLIDPKKDLDCIGPENLAGVFSGEEDCFAPCTAEAVIRTIRHYGIPTAGKRAVVIGRSMVVGKPLAMMLLKENATVTLCHTKTKDLKAELKNADIVAAAAGKARMIDASYTRGDAVVLDVGINVDADGRLCGDADTDSFAETDCMVTPVPGGIGAVTTAVLAEHLVRAALRSGK